MTRTPGQWSVLLARPTLSVERLWEAVEAWPQLTRLGRRRLLDHPHLTDAMRERVVERLTLLLAQGERLIAWDPAKSRWRTRIPLENAPGQPPLRQRALLTMGSLSALGLRLRDVGFYDGGALEGVPHLSPRARAAFLAIAATRWRADLFLDVLGTADLPPVLEAGAFGAVAAAQQAWQGAERRPLDVQWGRRETIAQRLQLQRVASPTAAFHPAASPASWADLSSWDLDRVARALAERPDLSRAQLAALLAYATQEGVRTPTTDWGLLLRLLCHPQLAPADRQHWLRLRAQAAPRQATPSHRYQSFRSDGLLGAFSERFRVLVASWPVRDQIRLIQLTGPSLQLLNYWVRSEPMWDVERDRGGAPPAPVRFLARALWGRTPAAARAQAAQQVQRVAARRQRVAQGLHEDRVPWHQAREQEQDDLAFSRLLPHPAIAAIAGPFLLELWRADPAAALHWPAAQLEALVAHLRRLDPLGQQLLRPFLASTDQSLREVGLAYLARVRQAPASGGRSAGRGGDDGPPRGGS